MGEIQKDFFEELAEKDKRKRSFLRPREQKEFFFSSSFDTLLLGLLILVMGIVIVYAVGVEVGQKQKMHLARENSIKTISTPVTLVTKTPTPKKEARGRYTIQIASFTNKETAEQALEKVKKEFGGIEVSLIGTKQFALCVGSFETRAEADRALIEFQKRYRDSFVRNR